MYENLLHKAPIHTLKRASGTEEMIKLMACFLWPPAPSWIFIFHRPSWVLFEISCAVQLHPSDPVSASLSSRGLSWKEPKHNRAMSSLLVCKVFQGCSQRAQVVGVGNYCVLGASSCSGTRVVPSLREASASEHGSDNQP